MRNTLFIALILLSSIAIRAQENGQGRTFNFNLQECLQYAYENRDSIKNAKLDIESARYRVKETVGIGLPQISGTASFQDYLKVPQFPFPDITYGLRKYLFDEGVQGSNGPLPDPGEPTTSLVGFQQKYNANYAVSANQLIFNGTYLVGLRASKTFKELSEKNLNRTKISTTVSVTKAYYQVLVSNEQMRLLDANVAQLAQQLKETTELNIQGFVEKIDLDRLRVIYNNLLTDRENTERLLILSKQLLKFQMGMPITESLEVKDKIANINLNVSMALDMDTTAYKSRIEYSLLETQRKLNDLNVDRLKSERLPSLAAFGSAGNAYQSDKLSSLFDTNLPSVFIGLQLNVPIFNGFQRKYQIKQAEIEARKTVNILNTAKNGILLQQQNARITYQNAIKSLNNQKANMDLASEVLRVSKVKYQEGVGSSIEVTQAQTERETAENNYIQALYNVLVSKVDLDNAYGRIQ